MTTQPDSRERVLQIITSDRLSLWTKWSYEVIASLSLGVALTPGIKFLAYLPVFWRPYALNALGLPDSERLPFILDNFGLHRHSPSFWPHWTLVGIVSVLILALRRLDFTLRCTGPAVCSEDFVGRVTSARDRIPRSVQQLLAAKGYRIVVCSRVVDALPHLLQVAPRSGYKTYEYAPALFSPQTKNIIISEFHKSQNRWVKSELDIFYLLAHEIGHALDHFLKGVTNTQRFKEAYRADYTRLNSDDKIMLAYFIQSGSKFGRQETFAEIFSSVLGQSHYLVIEQKFPETAKLVREVVSDKASITSNG